MVKLSTNEFIEDPDHVKYLLKTTITKVELIKVEKGTKIINKTSDYKIALSNDYKIALSNDYKIALSNDYKIALSNDYKIAIPRC
jgi:hypothetical protein